MFGPSAYDCRAKRCVRPGARFQAQPSAGMLTRDVPPPLLTRCLTIMAAENLMEGVNCRPIPYKVNPEIDSDFHCCGLDCD